MSPGLPENKFIKGLSPKKKQNSIGNLIGVEKVNKPSLHIKSKIPKINVVKASQRQLVKKPIKMKFSGLIEEGGSHKSRNRISSDLLIPR